MDMFVSIDFLFPFFGDFSGRGMSAKLSGSSHKYKYGNTGNSFHFGGLLSGRNFEEVYQQSS
jgi:hypothetical protein